jgi:hypothetical protein
LIFVALGCFDRYNFDYNDEFARDFMQRDYKEDATAAAACMHSALRAVEVRIHSYQVSLKQERGRFSPRMEFWRTAGL